VNRRIVMVAGATVLAGGGVGAWRWWLGSTTSPATPATTSNVSTAAVTRTDLTATEQLPGTLGYAGDWRIEHPGAAGVLTSAPAPGTVVQRGQALYEVDGSPVFLLYGERLVWRDFTPGMSRGEDVRQLRENLVALGFDSFSAETQFSSGTATAIRRWQRSLGRPQTGRIPLGTIVFAPEALRLVEANPGRIAGPVVRASSTRRVVTVALPTSRQGLRDGGSAGGAGNGQLQEGATVQMSLPGGERFTGTVEKIGKVAVSSSEGSGPAAPPTIAVTIGLTQGETLEALDQAPVQVTVATATRKGVLAVPITALRAAASSGYEVVIVDGAAKRQVPVRPGLLDERAGLIEVTGDGIAEGMRVEVPSR